MPAYNTLVPPPALYQGDSFLVFKTEATVASETSQQVALPVNQASGTKGVRIEIDFNQNPGNVEILVVESSQDSNGASGYNQVPTGGDLLQGNLQTGPNGASTRLAADLIPIAGEFCALFVKTAPSNGNTTCSARISRTV